MNSPLPAGGFNLNKIRLLNTSSTEGFFSNQVILFKKSNVFWCEM